MKDKWEKEWQRQFEKEFGIHFKNSPDELGFFLLAFIEETFISKKELQESLEGMKLRESTNNNKYYKRGELIDCGFNSGLEAVIKKHCN